MIRINNTQFKSDTVLEIGKFSILWNMFEHTKFPDYCNDQKLIALANQYLSSEERKLFAIALQNRARSYQSSKKEPIKDDDSYINDYVNQHLSLGRGLNKDLKGKIIAFIKNKWCDAIDGGLLAIYRIRNNMFHGLKLSYNLDGQIDLFRTINTVLESILLLQ